MDKTKIAFILMALIILVMTVNRVNPTQSLNSNIQNLIGCQDYLYHFNVGHDSPTKAVFIILDEKYKGEESVFKTIYFSQAKYYTDLHCGYKYKVTFTAEGYEDYTKSLNIESAMPKAPVDWDIIPMEKK